MEKKINFLELYKFIRVSRVNNLEAIGFCPFHNDEKESFAFSIETGLWKCFAGCGQGNAIQLISRVYKVGEKDANDIFNTLLNPIQEDYLQYHATLLNSPVILNNLLKKRGWSKEIVLEYKIGYSDERFTIPVLYRDTLLNIRKYAIDGKKPKMLNVTGYGNAKLFPYNMLKEPELFLFEGESDCLLALSLGLPAITVTSGAGTWKKEWSQLLKGKKINICYDIDEAGKRGAEVIASQLLGHCEIKNIKLPITEPSNADFSDYILHYG